MLHHRGKSFLIGLCLVLLTTGGLVTIVGSGGSDPDPEGSMRTFMNNSIRCGGFSANTQITINGQVMNASSGNFSGCVSMPPGTYNTRVRLSAAGCPTRIFNFNMSIADGCTTNLSLDRVSNNATTLYFSRGSGCPGACRSSKVKDGEEANLLEETFEVEASEAEEADGYDW